MPRKDRTVAEGPRGSGGGLHKSALCGPSRQRCFGGDIAEQVASPAAARQLHQDFGKGDEGLEQSDGDVLTSLKPRRAIEALQPLRSPQTLTRGISIISDLSEVADMGKREIRRAGKKVVGKDGVVTKTAELLPGLNRVAWEVHNRRGNHEQAERAAQRNPIGTDGLMTKIGECIPGISDMVRQRHLLNGETEAAERARGFSIGRYFSQKGALTKAAALLPGSNIVAALLMEAQGNHEGAKEALDIVQAWRNINERDGALLKLAEMFPGTDLIAFGLHASHGEFAHALRSACKTRFIVVEVSRLEVAFEVAVVASLGMLSFDVGDFSVHPVAGVTHAALMDLGSKFVSEWQWGGDNFGSKLSNLKPLNGKNVDMTMIEGTICKSVDDMVSAIVTRQCEELPKTLDTVLTGIEGRLSVKRTSRLYRLLLPEKLPRPGERLTHLLQDVIRGVTITHSALPDVQQCRPQYKTTYRRALPEASAALSCLSFGACLGLGCHTGLLGCFAGCLAGVAQGLRYMSSSFVPRLNEINDRATGKAAMPEEVKNKLNRTDSMSSVKEASKSNGVIAEVPDVPALLDALSEYVLGQVLASWRVGRACAALLRVLLPALRIFLADLLRDVEDGTQLVLAFSVPSRCIKLSDTDQVVLPQIPFTIVVNLHMTSSRRPIRRICAVLPDWALGELLDQAVDQATQVDLRNVSPKLSGFVEPLHVQFNVEWLWATPTRPSVVFKDFSLRMALPD